MKKNIYIFVLFVAMVAVAGLIFHSFEHERELSPPQNIASDQVETSSLPVTLLIPKLDIEAKVENVGVTKDGDMATPENASDVGWYKFGTAPGALGSAVIAGHLDTFLGLPAVFSKLSTLVTGDDVYIVNEKGEKLHFVVTDKKTYDYNATSTKDIFESFDGSHLNLITCHGSWLKKEKNYDKRLVVFTKLQL